MASKQLMFDQAARQKVFDGLEKLAKAVKVTLGPSGRNVILQKSWGSPQITKDGVTVAKEVELSDPIENLGAQMVKEVATKTSDIAGGVGSLGGDFFHHLRAHVLVGIGKLYFLGDGHAVLGDGRRAEFFVDGDVAALGAEGDLDGAREKLDTAEDFLTSGLVE